MQNSSLNQSLEFAAELQNQFKNSAKRIDRGVKQANILVLWKTAMPSVLVEVGFICNSEEEKFMSSAAGKEKLATSIFQAFCSYKAKIEDRSSFLPSDHLSNDQPETPNPKPETRTAQPSTKLNPNGTALDEVKPEPSNQRSQTQTSKPKIEFCVQIATSSKPMDTHPNNFKKYRNVERIKVSPDLYKYLIGRTTDYAKVQESLKKARADFKDAFVVSIVDGKIYPVAEGLKLITE